MLNSLLYREMRQSVRRLVKTPVLTGVLIFTLAAVIGTEGLLLAASDMLFLRRLPYSQADRLVVLYSKSPKSSLDRATVSAEDFADWLRRTRSFTEIAAARSAAGLFESGSIVAQVRRASVSPEFFSLLGLRPILGSAFSPGAGAAEEQVVVSERFWREHFGADPAALGRTVRLDGRPLTIVGVAPADFQLPQGAEVWTSARIDLQNTGRGVRTLFVIARLRRGVSLASARSEMLAVARELEHEYPIDRGFGTEVVGLRNELVRGIRPTLLLLLGAATLALIIAAVNLANLQLVRTARQRRELGIRTALGASRLDLWRPLLLECLILAILGGAGGVLVAHWEESFLAVLAERNSSISGAELASRLLAFIAAVSLLTGFIIGLASAVHLLLSRDLSLPRQISSGTAGSVRFSRLQRLLVVLQIGLSLPLLVSCGVLVKNLVRLKGADLGFDPSGLKTISLSLAGSSASLTRPQALVEGLHRLGRLPWILDIGAGSNLPVTRSAVSTTINVEGSPTGPGEAPRMVDQRSVTAGYFKVLRLPILSGRGILDGDTRESPPVVVINAALSRQIGPGESPLGKHLFLGSPQEIALYGHPVAWRIVGVAADVPQVGIEGGKRPEIYLPYPQLPSDYMTLIYRVAPGKRIVLGDLRDALAGPDLRAKLGWLRSMQEVVDELVGRPAIQVFFFLLFTVISFLLVAISTYALVSHAVDQGARGIGISLALGAQSRDIALQVMGEAAGLSLIGIAFGVPGGFTALRVLSHRLVLLSGGDVLIYASAAFLLVGLVAVGGLVPLRRALAIEPRRLLQERTN